MARNRPAQALIHQNLIAQEDTARLCLCEEGANHDPHGIAIKDSVVDRDATEVSSLCASRDQFVHVASENYPAKKAGVWRGHEFKIRNAAVTTCRKPSS